MELLTLALWTALAALAASVLHRGYPLNVIVLTTIARTVAAYVARGSTPLLPHWTLSLEVAQRVIRSVADRYGDRVAREHYCLKIRRLTALGGDLVGGFACRAHGTEVTSVTINGLEHLWLKAKATSARRAPSRKPKSPTAASVRTSSSAAVSTSAASSPTAAASTVPRRFVVLFFHGGGYVLGSPHMYIDYTNRLRKAIVRELTRTHDVGQSLQVDVLLASYRKAPEHWFPAAPQDCVATYKHLITHEGLSPRQIILAGDSAGGGLVLSTLLRLRQRQPGLLPLAGLLLCPKTSMAKHAVDGARTPHCFLSPSMLEAFRTAYLKTPDDPSTWQDASPLHCDLRDLPPVFLQAATEDALYCESTALAEKVRTDGITNWEVDVHAHMPHIFAVVPALALPYGDVAIAAMGKFAARQFASTLSSRAKYLKHKQQQEQQQQQRVLSHVPGA